jgi:hypothetical protein
VTLGRMKRKNYFAKVPKAEGVPSQISMQSSLNSCCKEGMECLNKAPLTPANWLTSTLTL